MIEISLETAYWWLAIGTLIVWLIVYACGTSATRRKQLLRGVIAIPAAIALENLLFFQDYWFPRSVFSATVGSWHILVEDVIFGFSMGGLIPVLVDLMPSKEKSVTFHFTKRTLQVLKIHVVTYFTAFVLIVQTEINSMILIPIVLIGVSGMFLKSLEIEIFTLSVISGLLSTLILFAIYSVGLIFISNTEDILRDWWYLYDGRLDVRIYGVPITEMFWAFSYGLYCAVVTKAIEQKK